MKVHHLLGLSFLLYVSGVPLTHKPKANECGFAACHTVDPEGLNVHLIAHSHDDVGWLKTVDQYYYGSRSNIQLAGVQYIIDSVVTALKANPQRKFIQVETAFLWKWWLEQNAEKRNDFLQLINNGQLEIVGGAWSMNDEAAVHYHSVIDQFTHGLKFVDEILGDCGRPKIGWQIDPFGHTREMASIFAQLGFDALFFARLDWRDKGERLRTNTAEMLWQGSPNLGDESLLFTNVLYNHYSPPPGFYFDVLSQDDPLIPDETSPEYNLRQKVQDFRNFVANQARNYTTNNIIVTMGNDFTYQDAHYSFKNLDILIEAFATSTQTDHQGRRINLLYSTPACYVKAVNDDATRRQISFVRKTDDFIPYASDYHTYWSGYYTSRPTQKRFERQGNNLLQVAKQLTAFTGRTAATLDGNLDELRSAMGIMQHHDAITGTEKQHVAQDYARIVIKAFEKAHPNINTAIPKLLAKTPEGETTNLNLQSCLLANVSHCEVSQAQRFIVAVHNPLSRRVSHYVRLPVNSRSFTVTTLDGQNVASQVTPSIDDFSYVENITPSRFDLVFLATDLPPLGVKLFYVVNEAFGQPPGDVPPTTGDDRFNLGTETNWFALNRQTGLLDTVTINGLEIPVQQKLMYYIGAQGNNGEFRNRSSGAYIFRPSPEEPVANEFVTNVLDSMLVYKGELVDEVHQIFSSWAKQIIRIYKGNQENHVEFDWLVGPIDISDNEGREVISRFDTNLISGDFYTDSNGRELLRRRRGYRASFELSHEEVIAENYYPITSGINIADEQKAVEMAVLTDRAQGGSSLAPGQIELMVHRRLLRDDAFGVGEALNEQEFGQGMVARGQHYLTLGSNTPSGDSGYTRRKQRDIAQRKLLAPWVFVGDATGAENDLVNLQEKFHTEFSGLTRDLPEDVQILTFEPWKDGSSILLRLEHIVEASEGGEEITVDLNGLFTLFGVISLEEYTLGANQLLVENQRLQWRVGECLPSLEGCPTSGPGGFHRNPRDERELESLLVTLRPMQIRTLKATVNLK